MSFRLYLVRHGATSWNAENRHQGRLPGIGLSPAGIEQVKAQAATWHHADFAAVISSPLQRALDTARLLCDGAGIDAPIVPDASFDEWDIPHWNRLTLPEIEARFPAEHDLFVRTPERLALPGAETLRDVQVRALKGIEALRRTYSNDAVLVVTHAAVLAAAVCGLLGLSLTVYRQIPASNASLTVIEIAQQPMLQLFNWHPSKLE